MIPTFGMDGTKWRIFTAAVDQFAQRGYHAVSMRDIAKAVDIKTSSIYNHFQSKEEILTTVYNYYWEYFYEGHPDLQDLLAQVGRVSPVDILTQLVSFTLDEDMDHFMHKLFIISAMQMYSDDRAKRLIIEKMYNMPRRFFEPLFQKMADLDLIEPVDVDSYLLIHSSLCHATTLMATVEQGVGFEDWTRCHRFLMENVVRVKQEARKHA